tara:strand:- start:2091 stop:2522 length:432 start_codon:yes stop_codon:yes gene_type:complete
MEESVFSVLIDYGTLGITCGVLFWLHIQNTKRNDTLIANFQKQVEKLRASAKEEETQIRNRWMAVVEKYDMEREAMVDERTQLRSNLASQMKDIGKEIDNLKNRIEGLVISQESQTTLMKDIANEARLKELARAASKKDNASD